VSVICGKAEEDAQMSGSTFEGVVSPRDLLL